jgi:hypothetical protein
MRMSSLMVKLSLNFLRHMFATSQQQQPLCFLHNYCETDENPEIQHNEIKQVGWARN